MKITVSDHASFQPDKLAKIALAATERFQLDLYCVGPGQAQKPHTHDAQDKRDYALGSGKCGRQVREGGRKGEADRREGRPL